MGALITPMLALVMPLDQAIGLTMPIFIIGDIFAMAAHWRRWEAPLIQVLLLGGILGVILGTFVITNVSITALRRGLGAIALLFVLYRVFEQHILRLLRYQPRRWHGVVAGSVAGFTSALANAGGPAISIYLLMQNLSPSLFVATSVLFFAVLNIIKVPYYFYAGLFDYSIPSYLIWLAPLVPLGVWLGKRLVNRIDKVFFERIILFLLFATALLLHFR